MYPAVGQGRRPSPGWPPRDRAARQPSPARGCGRRPSPGWPPRGRAARRPPPARGCGPARSQDPGRLGPSLPPGRTTILSVSIPSRGTGDKDQVARFSKRRDESLSRRTGRVGPGRLPVAPISVEERPPPPVFVDGVSPVLDAEGELPGKGPGEGTVGKVVGSVVGVIDVHGDARLAPGHGQHRPTDVPVAVIVERVIGGRAL